MRKVLRRITACCVLSTLHLFAQQGTEQVPAYALQVQSRLVVEDVTVLDRQGKPVKGLAASAFHVFDNSSPEELRNFQELGSVGAEVLPPTNKEVNAPGTFGNAAMLQNRGTIAVLLIDPSTMVLEDQMYLNIQALKFVESASSAFQMAVFRVNSSGVPVLLQPLTRDKELLKKAISLAVPTRAKYLPQCHSRAHEQIRLSTSPPWA